VLVDIVPVGDNRSRIDLPVFADLLDSLRDCEDDSKGRG
jgi:hypothetical protein